MLGSTFLNIFLGLIQIDRQKRFFQIERHKMFFVPEAILRVIKNKTKSYFFPTFKKNSPSKHDKNIFKLTSVF